MLQLSVGLPIAVMRDCDRWPFLIVMPQKPDSEKAWEHYDGAVMAMLEAARKQHRGDPARTYLTGLSQGGHGTWTIAAAHPDAFAAIAPICGYGDAAAIAPKVKDIPTWCFHGEDDSVVPVKKSRDIIDAIEHAGGSPRFTTYPGVGHNSWDRAYGDPELSKWLLSHRRSP
jgi:predicted peptidase